MSTLEMRVGDVLSRFDELPFASGVQIALDGDAPVLATPLALAAAFAGGAAYGGAVVAAFEAGRAVRGG